MERVERRALVVVGVIALRYGGANTLFYCGPAQIPEP